ncbi:uncharacterized protein LOC105159634 isoform X2 [Sesamum indicum]|uniref:Uncharacterized protein LOC105159634 isoform X2 n=1 Tax=Sesamum indicum TaxID=4182 RepID=A0A8M8UQX9_SESIN|nr:uncharacterized protein LOC105159634 isoform X2 [Sesamum indicum]
MEESDCEAGLPYQHKEDKCREEARKVGCLLHNNSFLADMEKEERTIPRILKPPAETEFFLQWGSRKRLRCVRVRGHNPAEVSSSSRIRRRITSRFLTLSQKDACFSQPSSRYTRNSEAVTHRSESRKSSSGSLEKEERCYTTRGGEENGKITVERDAGNEVGDEENPHKHNNNNNNNKKKKGDVMSGVIKKIVWPKVCIGLSSKEKEEDFMAMKGCKLPQRPKKRAKLIQRTLLLVSPGAWLTDMSLERYEVREKKSCKKKLARGLKGMGSIESDSD